jgi:uncharacterized protein YqgC (DUF456 family)
MHWMALIVASLAMFAAVLSTLIPLLPGGALFVLVGALLYGWIEDFSAFTTVFWVGQVALVLANMLSDNVAQLFGIKKMGGSKAGMIGATLGMFVIPILIAPLGLIAVVFGPLVGAVVGAMLGEIYMRRKSGEVVKVGWGSALSFLAGTFFKLVLVAVQVIWFYRVVL